VPLLFWLIAWLVKVTRAKRKVENGSRSASGMSIVVLLLSLFVAAMGRATILAHRGLLLVDVLSFRKRTATLMSSGPDPGFAWPAQKA
jgi:hypothetical protein